MSDEMVFSAWATVPVVHPNKVVEAEARDREVETT